MHIGNKCNEESRGEYEIFNKQRVISEMYCEKRHQLFSVGKCNLELQSAVFFRKGQEKKF